jgi:hypothetical protein
MTVILLAISLTITFCVIAWHLAIYALPVMTGITAFQHVYATVSGFWLSALAAIGAAIGSIVLVIGVLGFAKNPALRLIALAIFAIPAVIAGYALVHGVTKHMVDSAIAINILGGIGGIVIGIAAVLNLNAVGTAALSR